MTNLIEGEELKNLLGKLGIDPNKFDNIKAHVIEIPVKSAPQMPPAQKEKIDNAMLAMFEVAVDAAEDTVARVVKKWPGLLETLGDERKLLARVASAFEEPDLLAPYAAICAALYIKEMHERTNARPQAAEPTEEKADENAPAEN